MIDKNSLDSLAKLASSKLGASESQIKSAMNSGDLSAILSKLNENDAKRLKSILSDKKATEKLLSTPEAQNFIKRFTKGK